MKRKQSRCDTLHRMLQVSRPFVPFRAPGKVGHIFLDGNLTQSPSVFGIQLLILSVEQPIFESSNSSPHSLNIHYIYYELTHRTKKEVGVFGQSINQRVFCMWITRYLIIKIKINNESFKKIWTV